MIIRFITMSGSELSLLCPAGPTFYIWSVTVQHKLFDHDPVGCNFSNLPSVDLSCDSGDCKDPVVQKHTVAFRCTKVVPLIPLQRCYTRSLWEDALDIDLLVLMRLEAAICGLAVYHPLCCPIILSTIGLSSRFPLALPVLHPSL